MAGTLVANTINTDTGLFSTNNAYLGMAKAWINYSGTTQTINSSFNVSSVTRNGAGSYTVNFSTAVGSNPVVVSTGDDSLGYGTFVDIASVSTTSTTIYTYNHQTTAGGQADAKFYAIVMSN